jgi:HPr kinase/phosphorylase
VPSPGSRLDAFRLHASCAARGDHGVLLLGPAGAGKSDLLLRLVDRGFSLVADDQVDIQGGYASAPVALEGMVEAHGLGILRLPHRARARIALVVSLQRGERLPMPARYDDLDLPMVSLDPWCASTPLLVELALDGVLGKLPFVAGAFGS